MFLSYVLLLSNSNSNAREVLMVQNLSFLINPLLISVFLCLSSLIPLYAAFTSLESHSLPQAI